MAALICIAQNDSQQLLDEIVQQEGLEYATDVVISRQCIARRYESDSLVVTLQYQDGTMATVMAPRPITISISVCVSICRWQRKVAGSVVPINSLPHCREYPKFAVLYCADPPGKPEIANELASLESSRSSLHSKEWLKVVATDNTAVKTRTILGLDVFSDREASYMSQENRFGYAACASLCANKDWQPFRARQCMLIKKIAAVCWYKLTIRKSSAPCC